MTNEKQNTNMNWKGFTAHMIRTIIWPAVVLTFIFGFRGVIKEKIAQADHLSIAGVLDIAFPIAEKIIADKETLAKIESDGINSEEDLQAIDRIISTSSLYASLLSDAGFKGEIVNMSNANYDSTQNILEKIDEIKKIEANPELSATVVSNFIDSKNVLDSFEIKIDQVDTTETKEKIRKLLDSPEISSSARKQLENIRDGKIDIKKTYDSMIKANIDPKQIPSLKIDPKVLRKIDSKRIRKSIRPRK